MVLCAGWADPGNFNIIHTQAFSGKKGDTGLDFRKAVAYSFCIFRNFERSYYFWQKNLKSFLLAVWMKSEKISPFWNMARI